jgi:hypothetical protein
MLNWGAESCDFTVIDSIISIFSKLSIGSRIAGGEINSRSLVADKDGAG